MVSLEERKELLAQLSKGEAAAYGRIRQHVKEWAKDTAPNGEAWGVGGKASESSSVDFENGINSWVSADYESLIMIHASVINSAVGWFRNWGILKYLLGGGGLALALFGFILPTISIAERAIGLFCFCGGLVITVLVSAVGWFIPSSVAYGLYYGDWWSLDNKKLYKVLIKHRSSFNLGPELRERCGRVNFGLGLSANGYEIMNGLAPEWTLSFGELLETVTSLAAN